MPKIISTDFIAFRLFAWLLYTALSVLLFMFLSALGVGEFNAYFASIAFCAWMGAFNKFEPRYPSHEDE